ncbi:ATPase AAA domain-containing protein 2B [Chamberlinius hualienensis]
MVRTRRMDNGDVPNCNKRCSSRNVARRNYAGNDEDDFDDDDASNDRIRVRRRKIKIESPNSDESVKSFENTRETRSRVRSSKEEDDSNVDEEVDGEADDKVIEQVKENGSGIRRSTRKKKFTYDTLNQKWLLEGRVTEYSYLDSERRRLRRGRKIIDVNESVVENEEVVEEEEGGGYSDDMYTRIKRDRRKATQHFYRTRESKKSKRKRKENDFIESDDESDKSTEEEEEEDTVEETTSIEDEDGQMQDGRPRTYYLRQKRPEIQRFQVQNEPSKLRDRCKSLLHLSPPRRHIHQNGSYVSSFLSPVHRSPLYKRRRTTQHTNGCSSSSSSGSDDDRDNGKSLVRARSKILPINLSSKEIESNFMVKNRLRIGSSLADVDPMSVDKNVSFESVGGLMKHIQGLKEMLLLPLMYPEIFEKFRITPPRGVLFYGPPGTGKTLLARALANECTKSERKVAFFMRKGADCLSKWVGESERQLRLLFDQAYTMRPSIIFFDEIDGLAPVRSSRQDQIHSSIVSTLLALMDGLDNRGEVVVIGATNRIDAIDPALRRPGRFDREFNFSLPPCEARRAILNIHTKEWDPPLGSDFLSELAQRTNGYCGADLKALCAEATFLALRRQYPEIYTSKQKLKLDVALIKIEDEDFQRAVQSIVPASQRSICPPARPLPFLIRPLLNNSLNVVLDSLHHIFPQGFLKQHLLTDEQEISEVTGWQLSHRPRLLLTGSSGQGQSSHLGPAVLHQLEKCPVHKLDLPSLYAVTAKSPEESCAQIFVEAQRLLPSILYVPHCSQWWDTLSETVKVTFLNLIEDVEPSAPLLLLATSDCHYDKLPSELANCFDPYNGEVIELSNPTTEERREYFEPVILKSTLTAPRMTFKSKRRRRPLEPVETLPPRAFTQSELKKLEEDEEATMRELRLFLREILHKLIRDRRFTIFAKPVDTSEVSDYLQVIKNPMDFETMMSKIDLHKYQTVGEFLNDIDLVTYNALEYNPDRFPSDRVIRHRACALRDIAHTLINSELDQDFERMCEDVREARKVRGVEPSSFAPKHYSVPPRPITPHSTAPASTSSSTATSVSISVTSDEMRIAEEAKSDANGKTEPISKKSPLSDEEKDRKYRNRLMSRRKKSPWLVVRRRRRMVQPLKLVVYSEDSLDAMSVRDGQQQVTPSSSVNGHESTPATEEVSFFHKEKPEVAGINTIKEEDEEESCSKRSHLELASNESVMSVDSLSSNNLSSLSNTDETNTVPTPNEGKPDEPAVQLLSIENIAPAKIEENAEVSSRCSSRKASVESTGASVAPVNDDVHDIEVDVVNLPTGVGTEITTVTDGLVENEVEEVNALEEEEEEEEHPPFVVDELKAEQLLLEIVNKTKDFEISALERIHCRISRCVYRHQNDWDRTDMLNAIASEIDLIGSSKQKKMCSWIGSGNANNNEQCS